MNENINNIKKIEQNYGINGQSYKNLNGIKNGYGNVSPNK